MLNDVSSPQAPTPLPERAFKSSQSEGFNDKVRMSMLVVESMNSDCIDNAHAAGEMFKYKIPITVSETTQTVSLLSLRKTFATYYSSCQQHNIQADWTQTMIIAEQLAE